MRRWTPLARRSLAAATLSLLALPLASCGGAAAGPNLPMTYRFQCVIDGTAMAFKTVSGLKFETETIEFNPGNGNPTTKFPIGPKQSTFFLKRPYVGKPASEPILDWIRATLSGQDVRKNVSIVILDRNGSQAGRYDFRDCFLTGYSLTPLDADSDQECEETVEVCTARSSDYLK